MLELNKIHNMDCIEGLKQLDDNSIDCIITSPPYFNLRDYGDESGKEIGRESSVDGYINNLIKVFSQCYRVLKDVGSLWINIGDTYDKRGGLLCVPDRLKLKLIELGFICRNEVIWHKPNAMPCSAKNRFNNDYEKFYFFVKSGDYKFNTQYEPMKTIQKINDSSNSNKVKKSTINSNSKYLSLEQESSVRQGMNKSRGTNIVEVRRHLPTQEDFVSFIRSKININTLCDSIKDIPRTKMEHWFRRDHSGFAYPSVEDWNRVKYLLEDDIDEYKDIDFGLTKVDYETDDINKNAHLGRIKRAVWSINTKGFKGCHFAPYPEELVKTPILACTNEGDVVLDPFMGSGTTGVVSKKLNRKFVGIELNKEYIEIAKNRIDEV